MEQYFDNIFEDIRHELSLILLLSLVEPSIIKQSKIADHEIDIIKNIASEKLHRQRNLKNSCFRFVRKTFFRSTNII